MPLKPRCSLQTFQMVPQSSFAAPRPRSPLLESRGNDRCTRARKENGGTVSERRHNPPACSRRPSLRRRAARRRNLHLRPGGGGRSRRCGRPPRRPFGSLTCRHGWSHNLSLRIQDLLARFVAAGMATIRTAVLVPMADSPIGLVIACRPCTKTDFLAWHATHPKGVGRIVVEGPHFSRVRPNVSLARLGIELDPCFVFVIAFDTPLERSRCRPRIGWGS
jgi:hypothetical protein